MTRDVLIFIIGCPTESVFLQQMLLHKLGTMFNITNKTNCLQNYLIHKKPWKKH